MSDIQNAQTSFQHQIDLQEGIMVFTNIQCEGCGLPITCAKKRFVCKNCSDVDLCDVCLNEHQAGVREVSSCPDYSFLEIVSGVFSGPEQGALVYEINRVSWLQGLMIKYPK